MKTLSLAPRGLLLSLMLLLTACQPAPTQTRIQGHTMGTYYAVTLSDPFPGGQGALQQEVEALLARLNKEISTYDPGSLISRFNQGTGLPPQVIPATMAKIVQQGIDAGHLTRGGSRCHRGPPGQSVGIRAGQAPGQAARRRADRHGAGAGRHRQAEPDAARGPLPARQEHPQP